VRGQFGGEGSEGAGRVMPSHESASRWVAFGRRSSIDRGSCEVGYGVVKVINVKCLIVLGQSRL
jgi:hypothetical protein